MVSGTLRSFSEQKRILCNISGCECLVHEQLKVGTCLFVCTVCQTPNIWEMLCSFFSDRSCGMVLVRAGLNGNALAVSSNLLVGCKP